MRLRKRSAARKAAGAGSRRVRGALGTGSRGGSAKGGRGRAEKGDGGAEQGSPNAPVGLEGGNPRSSRRKPGVAARTLLSPARLRCQGEAGTGLGPQPPKAAAGPALAGSQPLWDSPRADVPGGGQGCPLTQTGHHRGVPPVPRGNQGRQRCPGTWGPRWCPGRWRRCWCLARGHGDSAGALLGTCSGELLIPTRLLKRAL